MLAPLFTLGYENLLQSRVSTAFAKIVQCETERCLLVAAGRLATDSQSEIEQQGSCHINNRKCKQEMCVMSTAAGERKVRNVKRRKACELE